MQTHMDLIYEQLDTLLDMLQSESHSLGAWVDRNLSDWHQDDYHTLVHDVEQVTTNFSSQTDGDLRTRLYDVREFASLLLNTQQLDTPQLAQLRLIYLTSADLLDILEEVAVR